MLFINSLIPGDHPIFPNLTPESVAYLKTSDRLNLCRKHTHTHTHTHLTANKKAPSGSNQNSAKKERKKERKKRIGFPAANIH
jgi:hypothetical protein